MTPKERIMPVTVPVMPSSGESEAISTKVLRRFSRPCMALGA
ncbi:MAG: hypothetical protein BWZ09_02762 [Alphaproteobacteria bacterium ADurb.BinA305]|nr:MAG: hypothetical protein BWZ09_02762 [Alphaproteobacteria bacterium ADurb.BinA305]